MTQTRADILNALSGLLSPFNTAGVVLSPETDISADLKIDSVTVMDFVMEVEDHFDVEIPLNILSEIRTLGELTDVVEARVNRSRA
jgi:acyl carrier protein